MHPAASLIKLALSAVKAKEEEDPTITDLVASTPESVLVPVGGLAGMSFARKTGNKNLDLIRGGVKGLATGAGAAGGAMLGRHLSSDDPLAGTLFGGGAGGLLSYLAARQVLKSMFPEREDKQSKEADATIDQLKEIKFESDRGNWTAKHHRIRELMHSYPDDWYVDSADGHLVGITHKTGFKFHMPRKQVPSEFLSRPVGVAPWQT